MTATLKNKGTHPRFAVQILYFDCDQFILRTIANCAPHVEKIFISYSPEPWTYNAEARHKFKNPSDPRIIENSPHRAQVELFEGTWDTEEAQRNAVLDRAKAEGFDYLIVQDADEFFHHEDYERNLAAIRANPDHAFYKTTWIQFWRNTRYAVVCRYSYLYRFGRVTEKLHDTLLSYSMAFAVNLRAGTRFKRCRMPTDIDDYLVLPGNCYHLSYVLSDEQVFRKIGTYGHARDISRDYWYRTKWKAWRPASRSLHPIGPSVWTKAVPFVGQLPPEIQDLPDPLQTTVPLGFAERAWETLRDGYEYLRDPMERAWDAFRSRLRSMTTRRS